MRIGINALYLLPGKVGGTEIHLKSIVEWFSRIDTRNEYFIFVNRESAGIFEKLAPSMKTIVCPIQAQSRPARILWEQFILPFQVKKKSIDVLLSTGMTAPVFCPCGSVLVIHDLQHENQPENFPKIHLLFLKSIIRLSSMSADRIIAISRKVKEDIIKYYKIPEARISIAYNGVDASRFYPRGKDEVKKIRSKYGLPEKFILYIASSLPHKNYIKLLEAFKLVNSRMNGIKLVLIGARDYGHDVITEKISELGLLGEVVFLGWLPYEDIPVIYCASETFVFPSLHEGFGIPVVEAMGCGVPVVCSEIEPLIEIAGDAALFIDPRSADSIAEGIRKTLDDGALRERLKKAGFERSKLFSWERSARDVLKIVSATV